MELLKNLQNLNRVEKQTATEETKISVAEIEQLEIQKKIIFIESISFEAYEALELACKNLITECKEGLQDVLQQFYYLRKIQDAVEKTIAELQPLAVDKAINMHREELRKYRLEIGYSSEILDYSQDAEVKRLEAELKSRKEKIKLATAGHSILDENTGEIIQPAPIKTPSKPYLKVCK